MLHMHTCTHEDFWPTHPSLGQNLHLRAPLFPAPIFRPSASNPISSRCTCQRPHSWSWAQNLWHKPDLPPNGIVTHRVFYAVSHFCLFLCRPLTHAHTENPNQGPKWSPSNNAHDSRADWGSGTGHPESLCVIQTHKVPISLTSRLMTLVRFLQFSTQDFVR